MNVSPPVFPVSPDVHQIDCFCVRMVDMSFAGNMIHVAFKTEEFVKYPREVAPDLVHLKTTVSGNVMRFFPTHFIQLNTSVVAFEFSVLQLIQGNVTATAHCHQVDLGGTVANVEGIEAYVAGWSRLLSPLNAVAEFADFCMTDKLLVYASRNDGRVNSFNVSSTLAIDVQLDARTAYDFQMVLPGTKFVKGCSIFVSARVDSLSEYFMNVVIPVFLARHEYERNQAIVIERGGIEFTGLERIVDEVVSYNISTRRCFSRGRFAKAKHASSPFVDRVEVNHSAWLLDRLSPKLSDLRDLFFSEGRTNVTVCDKLATSQLGANVCTELFDGNSLTDVARTISRSSELIVSDAETAPFGLFLLPGSVLSTTNSSIIDSIRDIAMVVNCSHKLYDIQL